MNLFRSEEHVKNWSHYDPVSAESIMPLSNWATVFGGPLCRNRLQPDYLSRVSEYAAELLLSLKKLGKAGPFWTPGQRLAAGMELDQGFTAYEDVPNHYVSPLKKGETIITSGLSGFYKMKDGKISSVRVYCTINAYNPKVFGYSEGDKL